MDWETVAGDPDQDYGGLVGIVAEARSIDVQLRQPRPTCPRCSFVLTVNPSGEVNCPMGHYRAPDFPTFLEGPS